MPTLEGARLLLRPLTLADAHHFAGLFGGDWDAVRQTGRMPYPPTEAAVRRWIAGPIGAHNRSFLLIRKEDSAVLGSGGIGGSSAALGAWRSLAMGWKGRIGAGAMRPRRSGCISGATRSPMLASRRGVSAFIATAFAQDHADAAKAQRRQVADQVRIKLPKLAALLDEAEEDVLVYMAFPKEHRAKIHSTNPLKRLRRGQAAQTIAPMRDDLALMLPAAAA